MTHSPAIGLSSAGRHTLCMECGEPWPCRSVGDSPTVSEPRTGWEDCDEKTCRCHWPTICPDCGCTHNEAEAAQTIDVTEWNAILQAFVMIGSDPDVPYQYRRLAKQHAARLRASDTDHD